MANEWIPVVSALGGVALAGGLAILGQARQSKQQHEIQHEIRTIDWMRQLEIRNKEWVRQDRASVDNGRSLAYLAFLNALQVFWRKFEYGLSDSRSGRVDFNNDKARDQWYGKIMLSRELRELDLALQPVELYGGIQTGELAARLCRIVNETINLRASDLEAVLDDLTRVKRQFLEEIQKERES